MVAPRAWSPALPPPVVAPRALGATRRVLRAADRRGLVLGLAEARGVDVVLTTDGPLALHPVWLDTDPGATEIAEIAADARRVSGRAGAVLAGAGVRVPAMAVVVAWGPALGSVPHGGRVVHEVMLVRGSELKGWLKRCLGHGATWTAVDAASVQHRLARRDLYRTVPEAS